MSEQVKQDSLWRSAESPPPRLGVALCPDDTRPRPHLEDARMRALGVRSGAGDSGTRIHRVLGEIPRGTLIRSKLTDDEREELFQASARRGVQAWSMNARKVRRSLAEASALDELCMWLNRYGLDVLFTVTFTTEYAQEYGLWSVAHAVANVRQSLAKFGYWGRLALGGEMTDREIPHVHGCLASGGESAYLVAPEQPREGALWRYFFNTHGRCRFEMMRDQDDATLYAFKDTLKRATEPGALYIRLRPIRGLRNARVHLSEQEAVFATRTAGRRRRGSAEVSDREGRQALETPSSPNRVFLDSVSGEHGLKTHSQ